MTLGSRVIQGVLSGTIALGMVGLGFVFYALVIAPYEQRNAFRRELQHLREQHGMGISDEEKR